MKVKTLGDFLSQVKAAAAESLQGGNTAFDLDDPTTKEYARTQVVRVQEASQSDWVDLFKWTTDDVCGTLTRVAFPEVKESSAELPGSQEEILEAVRRTADNACSISTLLKSTGDVALLHEALGIVAESADSDEGEEADEATEAEGEEVAEDNETKVEESGAFTVSDEIDETPWDQIDTGALKTRLREAKEAGVPGIDEVIQDVYACADVEDPSTWKYPHHTVSESGTVKLSSSGLAVSANHLAARFSGTQDDYRIAAGNLAQHFTDDQSHAFVAHVAEARPGVRMVTLEVQDTDGNLQTLDNTVGDQANVICVMESACNLLRDAGELGVNEPVELQIDEAQLAAAYTNLKEAADILMGRETVAESVVSTSDELDADNEELERVQESNALLAKKVDALQSLLDGSPLQGVAESVVGAESVQTVEAYKNVADSIGVKRLITAKGPAQAKTPKSGTEQVAESGGSADISRLEALLEPGEKDKADDAGDDATTGKPSKLAIYV